jgi:hypothetical protein
MELEHSTRESFDVLYISHPTSDLDVDGERCFTTLGEALVVFNEPCTGYWTGTRKILLEGPGISGERLNPDYRPDDDSDWRQERAMQAGMMGGCDAYNDEMGW